MISSIEWVPAGVADPNPKKYEYSAAELELIEMMENQNFSEMAENALGGPPTKGDDKKKKEKKNKPKIENTLPADLRMDEYSSDEDENDAVQGTAIGRLLVESAIDEAEPEEEKTEILVDEKMVSDDDNDDEDDDSNDDSDDDLADVPDTREYEPLDAEGFRNIGLGQVGSNTPSYMENDEEDDESEAEDVRIHTDDAIIVVAKTDEDFASLEVNVYEEKTGNLFVHHDIPLPAFPLCLAHGDISPNGSAGNFCAVGTFNPGIEIWNLDVLNALEPSCMLGGDDTSMADEIMKHNMMGSNKKFKAKQSGLRVGSHTDAVMALSWNKVHRQVIASGSADCTVKLWDVTQANTDQCNAATFSHHKDKVQSVMWHPQEGTLLATGSYDRTVALVDARSQENVKRVKIAADCESLAWDPFNPHLLTVASEDGTIACWDVRKFTTKEQVWSIVANDYGGVSDFCYNTHVPGMMLSCSVDKTVTLWDTYQNNGSSDTNVTPTFGAPKACGNKDMQVGKLYTVKFYPSSPWLIGCAGAGKEIALWDMTRDETIQKRFGSRLNNNPAVIAANDEGNVVADEGTQKEAFDAMMSSGNNAKADPHATMTKSKNKKKGTSSKKKKKAHRAGR